MRLLRLLEAVLDLDRLNRLLPLLEVGTVRGGAGLVRQRVGRGRNRVERPGNHRRHEPVDVPGYRSGPTGILGARGTERQARPPPRFGLAHPGVEDVDLRTGGDRLLDIGLHLRGGLLRDRLLREHRRGEEGAADEDQGEGQVLGDHVKLLSRVLTKLTP